MTRFGKVLFLLSIYMIFWEPLVAQFYIGNDIGIQSYDIQDESLGEDYYEKDVYSSLNINASYLCDEFVWSIRFSGKNGELEPASERNNYYTENYLDFYNYELDVEYYKKIKDLNRWGLFFGGSYNGHAVIYKRYRKFDSYSEVTNSGEVSILNLSLNGMLRYKMKESFFQLKVGLGIFNYGFRPEYVHEDYRFRSMDINNYFNFGNSLNAHIKLSRTFILKPEYRMQFYNYKTQNEMKMLKQSFLIGGLIRL